MHAIEPGDVVDLVQDRQREDLADAGDGAQTVERIGVVALRVRHDRELEIGDQRVVAFDEREIGGTSVSLPQPSLTIREGLFVRFETLQAS